MLVYRTDDQPVDARIAIERLAGRLEELKSPAHDELMSVFIEFGEIESAIVDCLFPDRDGVHPLANALRAAAIQSAHALIASWRQETDRRGGTHQRFRQCVRRGAAAASPNHFSSDVRGICVLCAPT